MPTGYIVVCEEGEVIKSIVDESAKSYVMGVLINSETERDARSLPVGGLGIVVMFVDLVLLQCLTCLNEHIRLKRTYPQPITMS